MDYYILIVLVIIVIGAVFLFAGGYGAYQMTKCTSATGPFNTKLNDVEVMNLNSAGSLYATSATMCRRACCEANKGIKPGDPLNCDTYQHCPGGNAACKSDTGLPSCYIGLLGDQQVGTLKSEKGWVGATSAKVSPSPQ